MTTDRERFERRVRQSRRRLAADISRETDLALRVACARCGAQPGQPCASVDGSPHAARGREDDPR